MRNQKGSVLIISLVFISALAVLGASFLKISITDAKNAQRQMDQQRAFFLSEAGIQRASWLIKQDSGGSLKAYTSDPYLETFQLQGNGAALNSLESENINISILYTGNDIYQVGATAQVNGVTKTLSALNERYSPGKVFDYAYFINNWGWFYASIITAYGDVRSNGRFDFKYGPTVNSEIYAGYEVGINGSIYGYGSQTEYQYPDSDGLEMPNLNDLSYYENVATSKSGSIIINGLTLVNGVLGDDGGENENLVLIGTVTDPIEINGTVVIRGDVIVSGYITGQGTIYAGRNLYVPNNVIYVDGPATTKPTYPSGSPPDDSVIKTWVTDNKDKDLVGFAATENIVLGDYTKSSNQWIFNSYLYGMGDEDVGEDGIPGTSDTGEGDGVFTAQYEDLDGDGVKDNNYTSATLQTQVALSSFANLPSGMINYADIANNSETTLPDGNKIISGVYYTNHAMTGMLEGSTNVRGSIISKDEAIGINAMLTLDYDWRMHSKYTTGQNKLIDVGLPFSKEIETLRWWEN
ncbi:hypothetical protein MNBD_UNCLBAC01-163 [hydrothermal vent metagenome]|uniref:Type 4 fimbrial biogenesis protein PilX N-terminal domain-containing protein n=1 Tax=hydrothermal vent metagenome TaxID=652676 RepID=A0A3B1D671_9ZZZZ